MTEISKSVFDPRNVALVLMGMGGTIVALSILSMDWRLITIALLVLQIGIFVLFRTRSTFKIVYDNKTELFTLTNRKEQFQIRKNQVLAVNKRFTPLQLIWPFPRAYYYLLSTQNDEGKTVKYGFIIWSTEQLCLRNYKMMKRSVEAWNTTSNQTNHLLQGNDLQ